MKKLTIYRNGSTSADGVNLLRSSAYQIYARTKELVKREGVADVIMTSHVPRAMQSAQVIKLAMPETRVVETALLSHYYAGYPKKFIRSFTNAQPVHVEHVVLVSHMMNISDLAHCFVPWGGSVTLEAESWEGMFRQDVCRRELNEFPADNKECDEIVKECGLSRQEVAMLAALPFIAD